MPSPLPRLRQVVLAARDLEAVAGRLRDELRLPEPFHDPGIGLFGLANAVFAAGDTFLEVVSPVQPDTAAGRRLDRSGGDGGYMAMFQLDDLAAARHRLDSLGVRIVHEHTVEEITDVHLHPRDVPGAIVALDEVVEPPGSWRWAGPAWQARVPEHPPGGVVGMTVASRDPGRDGRRWADVVGVGLAPGPEVVLAGGEQVVRFVPATGEGRLGIVAVTLAVAFDVAPGTEVEVGGVRFDLVPAG